MTFPLLPLTGAFSTYSVSVGIVLEAQVEPRNSCTSLRTLDGKLLPSHAVLRPLRLLPLSTLQHHLSLLEDEPPLLKEDLDAARTCTHTRKHITTPEQILWLTKEHGKSHICSVGLSAQMQLRD